MIQAKHLFKPELISIPHSEFITKSLLYFVERISKELSCELITSSYVQGTHTNTYTYMRAPAQRFLQILSEMCGLLISSTDRIPVLFSSTIWNSGQTVHLMSYVSASSHYYRRMFCVPVQLV
jgi:hypothetical protein